MEIHINSLCGQGLTGHPTKAQTTSSGDVVNVMKFLQDMPAAKVSPMVDAGALGLNENNNALIFITEGPSDD